MVHDTKCKAWHLGFLTCTWSSYHTFAVALVQEQGSRNLLVSGPREICGLAAGWIDGGVLSVLQGLVWMMFFECFHDEGSKLHTHYYCNMVAPSTSPGSNASWRATKEGRKWQRANFWMGSVLLGIWESYPSVMLHLLKVLYNCEGFPFP